MTKKASWVILGVSFLLIIGVALAAAAPLAGYSIDWWTVDGGGGSSSAGGYTLSGTIGQPDAADSAGGAYALAGGFWGAPGASFKLFLPSVTR